MKNKYRYTQGKHAHQTHRDDQTDVDILKYCFDIFLECVSLS